MKICICYQLGASPEQLIADLSNWANGHAAWCAQTQMAEDAFSPQCYFGGAYQAILLETTHAVAMAPKATNETQIELISDRSKIKIDIKDVFYAEVYGNATYLYTARDTVKTYLTLTHLHEKLGDDFLRCHRSYLVNMNCIKEEGDHFFILKNKKKVPISRNTRATIKQAYREFRAYRVYKKHKPQ